MTLLSTVYCTEAQIVRFFSQNGLDDYADHDADGTADADVVDDCINQATEETDLYLRIRYTQANLATSTLVTRWNVIMATKYLCERRGNVAPETVVDAWNRIADPDEGLLRRIGHGQMNLPGIALTNQPMPTMSNVNVDRRYRNSKIRVSKETSTNASTKLTQDVNEFEWAGVFN